jgi:cystathionine beta-lyase/cystathionine gamma-synthase
MTGFSGMISFYVKGGIKESKKVLEKVKIFSLAESLGGVESLIGLPVIMTHASVPKTTREKLGITDNLIRLSVGIEDSEDLIKDLEKALTYIK